jgi:hypothetical protein
MARVSDAQLIRDASLTVDRLAGIADRLHQTVIVIGDPVAAEVEMEATRTAAEQRAAAAEAARAQSEQRSAAAHQTRALAT